MGLQLSKALRLVRDTAQLRLRGVDLSEKCETLDELLAPHLPRNHDDGDGGAGGGGSAAPLQWLQLEQCKVTSMNTLRKAPFKGTKG